MTKNLITTDWVRLDDSDRIACTLDDQEIWDQGLVEGVRVAIFKTENGIEIVPAGKVTTK